jgi:hypothetical protein
MHLSGKTSHGSARIVPSLLQPSVVRHGLLVLLLAALATLMTSLLQATPPLPGSITIGTNTFQIQYPTDLSEPVSAEIWNESGACGSALLLPKEGLTSGTLYLSNKRYLLNATDLAVQITEIELPPGDDHLLPPARIAQMVASDSLPPGCGR